MLPAFLALYCSQSCWADPSGKLGALLQVTDPFALTSGCGGSHRPRQGTQGTLCQVLHEIRRGCCQYRRSPAQSLNKSSPSSSFLTAQSSQHHSPVSRTRHCRSNILAAVLVGAPHRKKNKQWKSFGCVCAEPYSPARAHFNTTTHCSVLLLS